MRWFCLALFALLVACSGGSAPVANAIPGAPNAPMGVLGPRLNARMLRLGKPHYFYNRSAFAARSARLRANTAYAGNGILQYSGGPVEIAPKAYLIFWGFASAGDATADPDGLAAYMTKFFAALPNSSWLDTVTQYYETSGSLKSYIVNPPAAFTGTYYDATPPASQTYTESDIANELVKVANIVGYDASTNYIVVSPHNYTISGFASSNGFCAYHTIGTVTGGKVITYTVFPYIPDAGYGCGANAVHSGQSGLLDGVSIVGGHEEAEAITDVNAYSGWIDSVGDEIADKCAWNYGLPNTGFPNGQSYPTQPLFSNATKSCVESYGGSVPTPTPSPTPSQTNVVKNPGFETGHLKPWTTCHSKGRLPQAFATGNKPHGGKYDAYAGTIQGSSEPDGTTSVCQLVTVPANGILTFWTRGVSDDFRSGVVQFARLYTTKGAIATTLYKIDRNEKKWHKRSYDLSAYGGGSYLLAFGVTGKSNARGRYIGQYVDDVTLEP